jgi:hypothetical protein
MDFIAPKPEEILRAIGNIEKLFNNSPAGLESRQ